MGCLIVAITALLALAVPASVARSSLVGAYVVIGLLAASAVAVVAWRARCKEPTAVGGSRKASTALLQIGVLTAAYAVMVTLIHNSG